MTHILPFFIVLFATLFFSEIFNRLHLPWVVALLLGGILIGPSALGVVEVGTVLEFMSEVGLVFLMFMAGLETRLKSFKQTIQHTWVLALINAVIPFCVGMGIGWAFDYSLKTSLLLGIIFISSSVAVVVPSLESVGLLRKRIGHTIISSTMLQDIASLILLSIVLQTSDPVTTLPLPFFYVLLVAALVALRFAIPKVQWFFKYADRDVFQQEIRSVFATLIGTVVIFELLGLHPIIAGFFSGLVLSEHITSRQLHDKLRTISYGLFIPIFFVVVGMKTDISVLFHLKEVGLLALVVIVGSMTSKFVSGILGARLIHFNWRESVLIASSSIPQLSTTLAVVFIAAEVGYVDDVLATAFVLLAIVSTFCAPLLLRLPVKNTKEGVY